MNDRLLMLQEMVLGDPDDSFISYALAKEYENLGMFEDALGQFLKLKTKDPNYVGLYYHLAKLLEHLEENTKALIIYNEGIEVAKKIPDFHALSELNSAKLNLEMEL
ncbi:MAG: tetratricopeptide repeat protein [Saprospiraceae bacterium]|nr:tetratricopeptide repeat protein [Saprospiraceae bacterium]